MRVIAAGVADTRLFLLGIGVEQFSNRGAAGQRQFGCELHVFGDKWAHLAVALVGLDVCRQGGEVLDLLFGRGGLFEVVVDEEIETCLCLRPVRRRVWRETHRMPS